MRITSNGQVTIPQEFREKLGLLPNTEVVVELDRDAVRIARAGRTRGRDLVAHMRGRASARMTTDQIMKLMRG